MAPPFIDPRANLKTAEESDEEVGDAPAAEDPVTDWVNNLNKFKTVGKDIMTVKASDLERGSLWRGLRSAVGGPTSMT